MAGSSLAVVAFFRRHPELETNPIRTIVAPVLAAIALIGVFIAAVANFDLLIGSEGFLTWFLPFLLLVAAIIGVIAALRLKSRSPQMYSEMGKHRE